MAQVGKVNILDDEMERAKREAAREVMRAVEDDYRAHVAELVSALEVAWWWLEAEVSEPVDEDPERQRREARLYVRETLRSAKERLEIEAMMMPHAKAPEPELPLEGEFIGLNPDLPSWRA